MASHIRIARPVVIMRPPNQPQFCLEAPKMEVMPKCFSERLQDYRQILLDFVIFPSSPSNLDHRSSLLVTFIAYILLPILGFYLTTTSFLFSCCQIFAFPFLLVSVIETALLVVILIFPRLAFILIASLGLVLRLRPCAQLAAERAKSIFSDFAPGIEGRLAKFYGLLQETMEREGNNFLKSLGHNSQHAERIQGPPPPGVTDPEHAIFTGPRIQKIDRHSVGLSISDVKTKIPRTRYVQKLQDLDHESWLLISHPPTDLLTDPLNR